MKDDKWLLIKHTLRRASVVLDELLMALQSNSSPSRTTNNVNQAKLKIIESFQDENILQKASEIIDYEKLVKELEASENKITPDLIKKAREL